MAVAQLLGHLARHLISHDASEEHPQSLTGTLSAALPAIVTYLSTSLSSVNPAVKLEAGKTLLRISRLGFNLPGLNPMKLSAAVPPAVAAMAIEALLELKERVLVEAALEEVVSVVASHLDVLQVGGRGLGFSLCMSA